MVTVSGFARALARPRGGTRRPRGCPEQRNLQVAKDLILRRRRDDVAVVAVAVTREVGRRVVETARVAVRSCWLISLSIFMFVVLQVVYVVRMVLVVRLVSGAVAH